MGVAGSKSLSMQISARWVLPDDVDEQVAEERVGEPGGGAASGRGRRRGAARSRARRARRGAPRRRAAPARSGPTNRPVNRYESDGWCWTKVMRLASRSGRRRKGSPIGQTTAACRRLLLARSNRLHTGSEPVFEVTIVGGIASVIRCQFYRASEILLGFHEVVAAFLRDAESKIGIRRRWLSLGSLPHHQSCAVILTIFQINLTQPKILLK